MNAALRHRGPDAGDVWIDATSRLGLGHRRLAIIDLSPAGLQPMTSADGRYVMVFNGEVYNFGELRRRLDAEARGIRWRGHSDSEVILEAIAHWGTREAVAQFNGMFALAVWDTRAERLTLVRDRMGVKPLFVGAGEHGELLFASELRALAAAPGFAARLELRALEDYLATGWFAPGARVYQDVVSLLPGSILEVDLKAGRMDWRSFYARVAPMRWGPCHESGPSWRYETYWSAAERMQPGTFEGSYEEALDACDRLLQDAVARRLVADVPLGAFLSGGVDSSLVVALMQHASARKVRTFSIGFTDARFDESAHARAVAEHLGTDHTEIIVTEADSLNVARQVASLLDEPLGDSSFIPTYLVSAATRKHVTVALTGDGGDELFGGYWRYIEFRKLAAIYDFSPRLLRSFADRLLAPLEPGPIERENVVGWSAYRAIRLLRLANQPDFAAAYRYALSNQLAARRLVRGARSRPVQPLAEKLAGADLAAWMLCMDQVDVLPNDLLVKVDRASMAVSLECREPLLDFRLVEFAGRLPMAFKLGPDGGKRILRDVLHRHVPRSLVDRPKQGFAVPLSAWLRTSLKAWARDLLFSSDACADDLIDQRVVERLWKEHQDGSRDHKSILWNLVVLRGWLDRNRR